MCEAPPPPPVPGTPLPCDRKLGVCRTKDIFQSTWKNVYFGSSLVSSRQFAKLMTTAAGLPLKKSRFPSGRAWLLGTSGSGGCGAAHPRSGGSRWARCSLSAGPTRGEGGGSVCRGWGRRRGPPRRARSPCTGRDGASGVHGHRGQAEPTARVGAAGGGRSRDAQAGGRGSAAQPTLLLKRRERLRAGAAGRGGGAHGRPRTSQRRSAPSCEAV